MFKFLTPIFCILPLTLCFSQPLVNKYSIINYDSIARSNVNNIVFKPENDYVCRLEHSKFQLSVSTKIKRTPLQDKFSDLTIDDVIFVGSYDIRARFYITPNIKVFQRAFITGLSGGQIFHTTGVMIKS